MGNETRKTNKKKHEKERKEGKYATMQKKIITEPPPKKQLTRLKLRQ